MRPLGLALLVAGSQSFAHGIPVADRPGIYEACFSSCLTTQRALPSNQALSGQPFLFDAYCSCQCARTVQRVDQRTALTLGQAHRAGRADQFVRSNASYRALVERNAKLCRAALFSD